MLKWLKDILGEEVYTEDIDTKVSQKIGELFVSKDKYNTASSEITQLKATITERDDQLQKLKEDVGATDALKLKIAEMEAQNTKTADKHKAEIEALKVDTAVFKALTESKAKNQKAVKALLDLSGATLEEDGTVKGLADQIKALKESEDTKFLFDDGVKKGFKGTNPGEGGGSGSGSPSELTKAQFYQLSYAERVKLKKDNPELYDKLKG